jgi:ceramide glucosyltransferase
MTISAFAAGLAVTGLGLHVLSAALAGGRCRKNLPERRPPAYLPPISIVQPMCGVEPYSRETLASIFALDYPEYEIVFCISHAVDPIAPLVRGFIDAHPAIPARLLVGDDRIGVNPKFNNVVKGWKAARHSWIVMADSNVLMPPDYLTRLISRWRPDTGIVSSPPIGSRPENFVAHLECAFLNTYQARWQYAAESVGHGFAQGKTMLYRRDVIEAAGGIEALGVETAEDAASTKLIRRQGLHAYLVDRPFAQPIGPRRLRAVWKRQLRWARIRRECFPGHFGSEIITTSVFTLLAAAIGARDFRLSAGSGLLLAALIWYGAEAALARAAGWPLSRWSPVAWLVRDLMLPWLWVKGWGAGEVEWRGAAMTAGEEELAADAAEPIGQG